MQGTGSRINLRDNSGFRRYRRSTGRVADKTCPDADAANRDSAAAGESARCGSYAVGSGE
ncbi:MAG TPA: hypothetical protein VD835_15200 [Pyrinomonadaceae bacterium]|nr:hypothetical protein [Pyrinomonadaceae bacterium]